MAQCKRCLRQSLLISKSIGLCLDCIRQHCDELESAIERVHSQTRQIFGLPEEKPRHPNGVSCRRCVNECCIYDGSRGLCGLRANRGGKLVGGGPREGNLSHYYDPLPTNCVADWVCPGGSPRGYPRYSYRPGPEYGYKNLAVFYNACSFNCLFCQNWHYRERTFKNGRISSSQLAHCIDEDTACICYFGGDPTPHLPHALNASRLARQRNPGRILRICWETNGSMNPSLARRMAQVSLSTGGCIKVDVKAWDESLHRALCGISNRRTLENLALLAAHGEERSDPPLLVASTLLVPGYVDVEEVGRIARFIASLNPHIPYALLAFHPSFFLGDLPPTSRSHAFMAKERAKREGLSNVRIGNVHLLGKDY